MSPRSSQFEWEEYRNAELARLVPILARHRIILDDEQPHISGERHLMQALTTTSGRKLILLATDTTTGERVVVKATSDPAGKAELARESACREKLVDLSFAYNVFHMARELLSFEFEGLMVIAYEYIDQTLPFLERPLEEQFTLALSTFKAQEGARASAHRHLRAIRSTFDLYRAETYLERSADFRSNILEQLPDDHKVESVLSETLRELETHRDTIDRYGGFLSHTDFVPHNIRVRDGIVYLLDLSSIRFGNKYDGWARFLNFMSLYNPPLLTALITYVRDNRCADEYLSLRLMRMYRLSEIMWYYVRATGLCEGDLYKLNATRVRFWSEVLSSVLNDHPLSEDIRKKYIATRDALRSPEEKRRQIGLH